MVAAWSTESHSVCIKQSLLQEEEGVKRRKGRKEGKEEGGKEAGRKWGRERMDSLFAGGFHSGVRKSTPS